MSLSLTLDEMLNLVECLGKASNTAASNYFDISDGTDWNGDRTRLVLKDSEYAGLILVRMKADKSADKVEEDSNEEEDPDPDVAMVSEPPPPPPPQVEGEWVECFEKLYFSKKHDWHHFQSELQQFCGDVDHMKNVDKESKIPQPSPPAPAPPVQRMIPSSAAAAATKPSLIKGKDKKTKRKRPNKADLFLDSQPVEEEVG